jgi:hypothetical protein
VEDTLVKNDEELFALLSVSAASTEDGKTAGREEEQGEGKGGE